MGERNIVRFRTSAGAMIAIEVGKPYTHSAIKFKDANTEVITTLVSSLIAELRVLLGTDGAKSVKLECAIDLEQDGDHIMAFVTRNPTNAAFKLAINLSDKPVTPEQKSFLE